MAKVVPIRPPTLRLVKLTKGDKMWFEIQQFDGHLWNVQSQHADEQVAVRTFDYLTAPVKTEVLKEA